MIGYLVGLAPYILQLLEMVPGFAKTIEQFRADISGSDAFTAEQKAQALRQAKSDVDAADDEVQAVDAVPPLAVPNPKPTAPG